MNDLEALGFSKAEILEKVVSRVVETTMSDPAYNEDGEPDGRTPNRFSREIQECVKKRINEAVDSVVSKFVAPNLMPRIETMILQPTNKWGEKQGDPMTFTEWCLNRATEYMSDQVKSDGTTPRDSYERSGLQPRLQWIVANGLAKSLQEAVQKTLGEANATVASEIEATVKAQLARMSEALRVSVQVPR